MKKKTKEKVISKVQIDRPIGRDINRKAIDRERKTKMWRYGDRGHR